MTPTSRFLLSVLCLLAFSFAFAESMAQLPGASGSFVEAFRFTQTFSTGTARIQALGGAQTALGADVSTLSANPAGLGFFRKSEVSITPSLNYFSSETDYLSDQNNRDAKLNVGLNNAGVVFSFLKKDYHEGLWRGGNFGISVSRVNNFQGTFEYDSPNPRNSLIDSYVEQANGTTTANFETRRAVPATGTQLAYLSGLISPVSFNADNTVYQSAFAGVQPRQSEKINSSGGQFQWNISYGANLADVFYVGLSVGIVTVNYNVDKSYREQFGANPFTTFDRFNLKEQVATRGTGANATLGIIVRPISILRIGASATTPTYLAMQTDYSAQLITGVTGSTAIARLVPQRLNYNLLTPWRTSLGVALFVGKLGFLTASVEYIDYTQMRVGDLNNNDFQVTNTLIKRSFRSVNNWQVGAELRLLRNQYLRGGFAYFPDPYSTNFDNFDRDVRSYSAGWGLRGEAGYFDITVVNSRFNADYAPYALANQQQPRAAIEQNNFNLIMSFGVFFR
ncbi:MAG TPA: hypothetical protein DCM08_11920 [Microscillaceae bacterium]|nr:hypothetical protein [Microscillaceae bacterium]